ncbi:MAG: hypothetical protein GAK37_01098 [Pseudomonas sp.]|nr:MAG: hypothetical protein GAK37_01098 [Pseudomonas sp.]
MQLPDVLQPWGRWLVGVAPEYWPLFADLLGRINPVLGPLRGRHQGGVPEFDGLGDLHRRGTYERLLSSEWLLADELPEEFLRRAAVGEHLFLAPQYRAREANRMLVVLFDTGPLQLGAARLIHLAVLILLARRAEEGGAQLRWGILQRPQALHGFDATAQLKQLLDARTYEVATEAHAHAWQAWLAEQPFETGECWMLGQRLPEALAATHRVQVSRSLDGNALIFDLAGRRVTLPTPPERAALALLKGQFDGEVLPAPPAKGAVPRVALTLPPVISSGGNYVALKALESHAMVVIKLPSEKQKKMLGVQTHHLPSDGAALAMVFHHRLLGGLVSDEQTLRFWNISGLDPVRKPPREELLLPPGTANYLPAVGLRHQKINRLYVLDTLGRLVYWNSAREERGKTHPLATDVLGLAQVDVQSVAFVRKQSGELFANVATVRGQRANGHALGPAEDFSAVLFAANRHWVHGFGGCALLSERDGRECWRVVNIAGKQDIELHPGWKAIGLLLGAVAVPGALLLVSPNQQSVTRYCNGQQEVLFTTTQPISRISYCGMSGLVAALTNARELLVYSVPTRAMRLQVMCNQAQESQDD